MGKRSKKDLTRLDKFGRIKKKKKKKGKKYDDFGFSCVDSSDIFDGSDV